MCLAYWPQNEDHVPMLEGFIQRGIGGVTARILEFSLHENVHSVNFPLIITTLEEFPPLAICPKFPNA